MDSRLTLSMGTTFPWFVIWIIPYFVSAELPRPAPQNTPWDDLRSALSSPDILVETNVTEWAAQCGDPFVFSAGDPAAGDGTYGVVSNYQLLNQTSGLCMDHLSCAYEKCFWPFPPSTGESPFPPETSPYIIFADSFPSDLYPDLLNLPSMVLHPRFASDVVQAVQFCRQHGIGITVKVTGHSYFGSSTARGTLLIKMSTYYPHYAEEGSLTECGSITDSESALGRSCALAEARGKNAVLRVGGGEMFDHAYRAVSFNWNENAANVNKYHLVGGGAGTVSAAGGWMASGGLSGTTGMRLFGIGIDQVLHLEMVLPSGTHVRFGPSKWTEEEGMMYPRTVEVTGLCNANPLETDESLWEWSQCQESIPFHDLWFAVRGGGGGSWGIVTSLYYQLHDRPGLLELVTTSQAQNIVSWDGWNETTAYAASYAYVDFLLRYLYRPSDLNVTEEESRGCNSAMTLNLNLYSDGVLFCYNETGSRIVEKWQEFVTDESRVESFRQAGIPENVIASFPQLLVMAGEVPSYAHVVVSDGTGNVPAGRLQDDPLPDIIPVFASLPNYADTQHTHFSLQNVTESLDLLVPLLALDVLLYPQAGSIYALGGAIPSANDQSNSLSPTRRNGAFLKGVIDEEIRDEYYAILFQDAGGDFPGSSCHNHALLFDMGPLKTNWTKSCPQDWSKAERDEKCISQNEAAWGTANLRRLESIKATIDPESLFVCAGGVGFSFEEASTSAPVSSGPVTGDPATIPPSTSPPESTGSSASPSTAPVSDPTEGPTSQSYPVFVSGKVVAVLLLWIALVVH
jgi:hypothetical protein